MGNQKFELVEKIKAGVCPITGNGYNCARCAYERKSWLNRGAHLMHMGICITGYVENNAPLREYKRLAASFEGNITGEELRQYFMQLHVLGVRVIPIGNCDRFCYVHGCLGHAEKDGVKYE